MSKCSKKVILTISTDPKHVEKFNMQTKDSMIGDAQKSFSEPVSKTTCSYDNFRHF